MRGARASDATPAPSGADGGAAPGEVGASPTQETGTVIPDTDEGFAPTTWWGGGCGCLLVLLSAAITVGFFVTLILALIHLWG
jgi:hypothetical protein